MRLFACRHPAASLVPNSGDIHVDGEDVDFIRKRIDMHCYKCGENIPIRWCNLRGGVDAFLSRGEQAKEKTNPCIVLCKPKG